MDRKEMEAKLLKHGLPQWGTDDELRVRLERNAIAKIAVAESNPTLGTVHAAAEAVLDSPKPVTFESQRKPGRPKKAK